MDRKEAKEKAKYIKHCRKCLPLIVKFLTGKPIGTPLKCDGCGEMFPKETLSKILWDRKMRAQPDFPKTGTWKL